jgi:ABC-2 type transport system ATP-binding protein
MYQSRLIALDDPDALKENMPGKLVEIDCDRPGQAIELLDSIPGVIDAAFYGTLMHVILESEALMDRVKEVLAENGIPISRIEPVLPSLEDVFVSMVEAKNRGRLRSDLHQGEEE